MVEFITSNIVEYAEAMEVMERRVLDVLNKNCDELVWFLEHPPIYTAGVSAKKEDLKALKFPVHYTSRGGKFTYHGPGQRVIYLVLDLKKRSYKGILNYITDLSCWIIKSLGVFKIKAFFDRDLLGIWIYENGIRKKIVAFGVRVKKWVTYHGVAINICNNLSHYDGIIPCGIEQYGVTSMRSIGYNGDIISVDDALKAMFFDFFA